jgi:hypothetical protein
VQPLNQVYTRLVHTLKLTPFNFDPIEPFSHSTPNRNNPQEIYPVEQKRVRDIPIMSENLPARNPLFPKKSDQIVELWKTGLAAKEIAARLGRTEKTVLNRLALLRKSFGDQVVPRRK